MPNDPPKNTVEPSRDGWIAWTSGAHRGGQEPAICVTSAWNPRIGAPPRRRTAARCACRAPFTVVKVPPRKIRERVSAIACTRPFGFGAHPRTRPVLVLSAATFERLLPPIVLNRPPTYRTFPLCD